MAQNNAALELINLLVTRNFNPEIFDVKTGNPPVNDRGRPDNSRANQFLFHFIGDSGEDYGTVEILFADGVMTVGSGNNTGRGIENPKDKQSWYDFLLQLKKFAVRHDFANFQVDNISRMKYLRQSMAQLTESFQGRGQYSWSGQPTEARMLIKHSRRLAETDARFRHIDSIFLETADGERYRLPTRSLAHGRAMLEHVRAGGRPWDSRGAHINHMVEQLQILSRFRRAHQGRLFEGDAVTLINETNNYFGSLRRNIKSLATKSGYKKYFESWQPDAVSEQELVVEDLRDLFVETRIDPRIEQALPLLAKIQEQNMKQADIFETWANRLVEGTWAIPDTEEKMTQLKLFLSQPQPVGADADAATSALSDILGDDSLFDMLEELAETDPDSDARPVVKAWLDANQNYPEILAIVRELEAEPDVDQEVSMTAQDLPDQQANMREGDNLANPLEEVMSPGAMGMFPEDQDMAETSISTQVKLPKWQIGLPVFVKHLGQKGKIASLGNDSAVVDVGMRQYRVPLDGLKRYPSQGVAEGSDTQLSIQQLATISDEALDNAYGYGRSSPGNTFGWQANLMSAAYAKKMIDAGVTDIEKISDAIHKGWNVTAQKFVQNPDQFDDTEKLRQAGKLEAKLQQRAKLMKINYAQLDNEEQEKDRVVARALLQAIKNQQGVAEGMEGRVVFSGTGANGSKYEIIQTGPTDFMIHANGRHIDTYSSLQRAMGVLKNEVPGLQQGVAEADKHSMLGRIQRHQELKKKVDTSFADIGKAQKAGDHSTASKAFRKHERYANLERPGTWTKSKEQGVAEGSEDSAEKYKAHLLKTAPRVMDFLAKAVKGWRPSEKEMLGAIDTAYTVMKHTGDVKQAGKAMMDELNTLHRMSHDKQGVAEGSSDTVYPNAEVIKSKNGKPVGEIYQDGNSWGAFHYRADRGYDLIDSREDAIEALRDLHQETGRSRPDYTIKGVAEGQCNMTEAGENCPVHGVAECWVGEVATDPKGWKQPTGAAFESSLARIKSLALLK